MLILQNGSQCWAESWHALCLLARLQKERHDQALYVPKTIQVSSVRMQRVYQILISVYRVGDIVDIKANGAVQKGLVNLRSVFNILNIWKLATQTVAREAKIEIL